MSDRFQPMPMETLAAWIFTELETNDAVFGIPRPLFFAPGGTEPYRTAVYGRMLDTPFGVAAGPHAQMAQNIVAAWLCGARFIELKTVQTLDELEISKPCIDMQDEGYNVEWSQELKIEQSLDEYVRAWVLVHALHRKLGFPGEAPGVVFNMSVGYNLEGLLKPNMQEYLRGMADASELVARYVEVVAKHVPELRDVAVPARVSDNVTLSTMHGCPPGEIEKISAWLLADWGLHTTVKLNPTLLGPRELRRILNDVLGFDEVVVPDEAFGRDLKYEDAVPMLRRLSELAASRGLDFGVKLSNTLEVENHRDVFAAKEKRMYLSGRPLHPVTVNLAARLGEAFDGALPISFSAGADAFNVAHLLRGGIRTVTVCSDLLKTGGYVRLLQYLENTAAAMEEVRSADLADYICKTARQAEGFDRQFEAMFQAASKQEKEPALSKAAGTDLVRQIVRASASTRVSSIVKGWAAELALTDRAEELMALVARACARINLRDYAAVVLEVQRYRRDAVDASRTKTARTLGLFDCIRAPCTDECPVDQKVPQYMDLVRRGRFDEAVEITREDNPLPAILGRACNHLCENVCIRTHLDGPLAIREIKRFIMEQEKKPRFRGRQAPRDVKVAVIGGGPCGLSVAYWLAQAGYGVTILERRAYVGGMVSGTIPAYRAAQAPIDQDLAIIRNLGVEIRFGQEAGRDVTLAGLRGEGFKYVAVAVGAQRGRRLGIPGEDHPRVIDALDFLRSAREGKPPELGRRIGVIGGGDVAMDCARTSWRLTGAEVRIIYRRTIRQMPAAREEIEGALQEGVELLELAKPLALVTKRGRIAGLKCLKVKLGEKDDSGRRRPVDVPGSEFVVPLDTLIVAISQEPDLDFLGDELFERTRAGYLAIDPETMETSVPGVFAGGDIAMDGPASIVKALGDGRRIAAAIRRREEGAGAATPATSWPRVDVVDLRRRRARKAARAPVSERPLANRRNFEEVTLTLSEEEARAEAARCLDCHLMCSLCASVCPNLAIQTYRTEPFEAALPRLRAEGGRLVPDGEVERFRVEQPFQVAVLTDLCNECGNCATFCPTSGRPYRDKPRLYLSRPEFEAEQDNAFRMLRRDGGWVLQGRFGGATHEITVGDEVLYTAPKMTARLDPANLSLKDAQPTQGCAEGERVSLLPCGVMYALLRALRTSAAHLPAAT